MKKTLHLFGLILSLLLLSLPKVSFAQGTEENVITMETGRAVGDSFAFEIVSSESLTIEGIEGVSTIDKSSSYKTVSGTLSSPTVKVIGAITKLKLKKTKKLKGLKAENCSNLTMFTSICKMEDVFISNCPKMTQFYGSKKGLESIIIKDCPALTTLKIDGNNLDNSDLLQLVENLTTTTKGKLTVVGSTIIQHFCKPLLDIAREKGWEVLQGTSPYEGETSEVYAVSSSQEGNGSITITGADDLNAVVCHTKINITATAEDGYVLSSLTANGADILSDNSLRITEATEIKAVFTPISNKHSISVIKEGEGKDEGLVEIYEYSDDSDLAGLILTGDIKADKDKKIGIKTLNKKETSIVVTMAGVEQDLLGAFDDQRKAYIFTLTDDAEVKVIFSLEEKKTPVEVLSKDSFHAYPSPASSQTTVYGIKANSKLFVYNLLGQVIKTMNISGQNSIQLDLSQVDNGYYIIKNDRKSMMIQVKH